jgi:hypothetical protein
MPSKRRKKPFWHRTKPMRRFDIAELRPKTLARAERFETPSDARRESSRSQAVLERYRRSQICAEYLQDCREGLERCEKTFCPICARTFRRYFTGQLLRLNAECASKVSIAVVLLETAPKGKIDRLQIERYRHSLRKRLERAGLGDMPVIGGFEVCYKAREKVWILHINLVIFSGNKIYRPITSADLNDKIRQLSYVLKFGTYHRPYKQIGSKTSKAVPLNPREHFELIRWMDQYEFSDHLFLFNARRRGETIEFSNKATRKACTHR